MDIAELIGEEQDEAQAMLLHQAAVGRNWRVVAWIKYMLEVPTGTLKDEQITRVWRMLPQAEQRLLWRAPTKGGCFTVEERTKLKEIL
jgi:hypothetical protein